MLLEIRAASPEVQASVLSALVEHGCPPDVAAVLAAGTTWERHDDGVFLGLLGSSVAEQDSVDLLAESVADDNAEAVDRSARGESGYVPWWPLPGSRPRR